jgi:hypothetical protein
MASQAPLTQSLSRAQCLPRPHAGQVPPPQSTSVSRPSRRWSAHWLATQVSVWASQALLTQSLLIWHPLPVAHGAQTGPPQSTSVSCPSLTPSLQVLLHRPAVQKSPAMHVFPQVPQFLGSVLRLVSQPFEALPSQLPNPALHVIVHWPLEQAGVPFVPLQAIPQPPQLLGSVWVLLQVPAQFVWPDPQVTTHAPAMHVCGVWQALVQAPQLLGSV